MNLKKDLPEALNDWEFVYENESTRRIDKVHKPFYFTWIDTAWILMLIKQGIIPKKNMPKIVETVLEFWENPDHRFADFGGLQQYVIEKQGQRIGGSLTIGRTRPPMRQQFAVRHELMKLICCLHDFQDTLLDTAEEHLNTVMPGYTHIRDAQPTTFGHYLLSVFDPVERIMETIEDGYHAMSLNELGCGALAGTSLPIDRNVVSEYLGLEELIENSNDAVSYTDGYVLLVSALANLMAVVSRMTLDLNYWSGPEYGFLEVPWLNPQAHGPHDFGPKQHSHMMPNKTANSPYLERSRVGAAELAGALMEVLSMGMRTPHGDMQEMLYLENGTIRAIHSVHLYTHVYIYTLPRMTVFKKKMLTAARRGYSCASELANHIVRDNDLDYRTAHEIVNKFVIASKEKNIPSNRARLDLLEVAAKRVTGKKLGISEERMRKALDPVNFVNITNSQGGVAPSETTRMLKERRTRMQAARARHLKRIDKLERSKEKLLTDLRKVYK